MDKKKKPSVLYRWVSHQVVNFFGKVAFEYWWGQAMKILEQFGSRYVQSCKVKGQII